MSAYLAEEHCGPVSSRRCNEVQTVAPTQILGVVPCANPIGAAMGQQQQQAQTQAQYQQNQQMMGRKMGNPNGSEAIMRSTNSAAQNANAQLDLNDQKNHLTAELYVSWNFTLAQASKNSALLTKKPKPEIFLKVDRVTGQRSGDLSRAIIFGAHVHTFSNRSNQDWALKIETLNQHIETDGGRANFIMTAGSSSGKKRSILKNEKMLSAVLVARFGHLNMQSLRKPLTPVKDENTDQVMYYVVPTNNIVVSLIAYNRELLGVDPSHYKPYNGTFHIDASIVDLVLKKVQEQVLDKIPYKDFNQLALTLFRPDGQPVDSSQGISGIIGGGSYADEQNVVSAVISVQYSFMDGKNV